MSKYLGVVFVHHVQQIGYHRGMAASPARGQIYGEGKFPVRAWEFGVARQVRPRPTSARSFVHTQAESGAYSGTHFPRLAIRDGIVNRIGVGPEFFR